MANSELNNFYQMLQNMTMQPQAYQERNLTGMRTSDPFLQGFAFGRELVKDYRGEKERLANRKAWAEVIDQWNKQHKTGGQQNTQQYFGTTANQIPNSPYNVMQETVGNLNEGNWFTNNPEGYWSKLFGRG